MPLSALAAIKPPSQKTISRLMQDRQDLAADRRAVSKRRDDLKMGIAQTGLKISQLKKLHHISTREEVIRARSERDDAWSEIKKGEVDLQQGAEKFETALFRADEVSDIQLDNVEKATELQGLQHQLERENQDLSAIENQHARLNEEIGKLDTEWAEAHAWLGPGRPAAGGERGVAGKKGSRACRGNRLRGSRRPISPTFHDGRGIESRARERAAGSQDSNG